MTDSLVDKLARECPKTCDWLGVLHPEVKAKIEGVKEAFKPGGKLEQSSASKVAAALKIEFPEIRVSINRIRKYLRGSE